MDKERIDILNEFYKQNYDICQGLRNWIQISVKNFKLIDVLNCVYDAADGKFTEMKKIIRQIIDITKKKSNERKQFGRSGVYGNDSNQGHHIDIVNNNGQLQLINYNKEKQSVSKGYKVKSNSKIFKDGGSGDINKNYQKMEQNLNKIGKTVRELYPNNSKESIENIIDAVHTYASNHKINTNTVLLKLKNKTLNFNPRTLTLESNLRKKKTIIISENVMKALQESKDFEMTEHKFCEGVKYFLGQLLTDPVNAQTTLLFQSNGLKRSQLIKLLIKNNLLLKKQKLSDKDENGQPKKVTMKVRYSIPEENNFEYKVPKEDFLHKLKKLYIKLFETNLPPKNEFIFEDGEGEGAMGGDASTTMGATNASSSGAYERNAFGIQRRKISTNITETDTCNVGNYEYTAPLFGDKETLARKNGKYGSVSINKV